MDTNVQNRINFVLAGLVFYLGLDNQSQAIGFVILGYVVGMWTGQKVQSRLLVYAFMF